MTGQQTSKQPKIGRYSFGRIEIDGRTYTSDVIILPSEVKGDWRRQEGHALSLADLSAVLETCPKVLIVGQGAYGYMKVPDETRKGLKDAGIETVCMPTAQAVELYNNRCERGDKVAAALHLTC